MRGAQWKIASLLLLAAVVVALAAGSRIDRRQRVPDGRKEVIFWHFWGGKHRPVVEAIVDRFNRSQSEHFVRAIAMPGHNLDLKFFLAVSGGDPPDLLNQDDPVVADWAHRGALMPIEELTTAEDYRRLESWLFPAARAIGSYRGRMYALCNGLDIRALYYDKTVLDEFGLSPPTTLDELDHIATTIAPIDAQGSRRRFGYLPDPRRLWAWGIVFGGRFYDPASQQVTADADPIVAALEWMDSYSRRYGPDEVAAFRKGDQALAASAFPLLQGRYAMVMDGQWRVAEIDAVVRAAQARGEPAHEFGVVPLPYPTGGKPRAGWINGNFFVVPRGGKNPQGAWALMKFWSGFGGHEADAAEACAAGGWIPASPHVVAQPRFQQYVQRYPLFREFVELADSPNQIPTPAVPVGSIFYQQIVRAAEDAMYRGKPPRQVLSTAAQRVRVRLAEVRDESP